MDHDWARIKRVSDHVRERRFPGSHHAFDPNQAWRHSAFLDVLHQFGEDVAKVIGSERQHPALLPGSVTPALSVSLS